MEDKVFGFWKEQGEGYLNFPGIDDYTSSSKGQDRVRIVEYLNSGGVVCVTSAMNFPNIITGVAKLGSIAIKTDGEWQWLENLVDYIEYHDVFIPDEWYDHMKQNNFLISQAIKDAHPDVGW